MKQYKKLVFKSTLEIIKEKLAHSPATQKEIFEFAHKKHKFSISSKTEIALKQSIKNALRTKSYFRKLYYDTSKGGYIWCLSENILQPYNENKNKLRSLHTKCKIHKFNEWLNFYQNKINFENLFEDESIYDEYITSHMLFFKEKCFEVDNIFDLNRNIGDYLVIFGLHNILVDNVFVDKKLSYINMLKNNCVDTAFQSTIRMFYDPK
ncbi:hypothetical protein EDEG_03492 [Edhazardia aedis USNM 41457]|uniref:Uncharacterized protein n=1 Tax=Edhazardia aedis (strain USNM 41457) TaxID=1003232 RepID=J8ZQW9_EDHAE|nr:hypothetical protein EDEG_03492 [Edhazardia aedis USNM 41457]|eukprot:EJW02068.1 hypothetical protein EDEG_03492 [Edhazardia aedis USNM 41457]